MNNMTSLRKLRWFFCTCLTTAKQALWRGPLILLSAIALSGCSGGRGPLIFGSGLLFPLLDGLRFYRDNHRGDCSRSVYSRWY